MRGAPNGAAGGRSVRPISMTIPTATIPIRWSLLRRDGSEGPRNRKSERVTKNKMMALSVPLNAFFPHYGLPALRPAGSGLT
jgi:hypothetical protein